MGTTMNKAYFASLSGIRVLSSDIISLVIQNSSINWC